MRHRVCQFELVFFVTRQFQVPDTILQHFSVDQNVLYHQVVTLNP